MTDSKWIEVDGAKGEGGGQMVRSSLALSMVTGKRVRISNVRAGREKPGLMRQHLTCVQAAAEVSGAKVTGDKLGSTAITFEPGPVKPGEYHFRIGTAGSASLVLQTLLPALILGDKPSAIVVEGGTHNTHAPPFEFLQRAFVPLVNRMGPRIHVSLEQYGFYPAGGGELRAEIQPAPFLKAYDIVERGDIVRRQVSAVVAHLALHIAEREVDVIQRGLSWDASETHCESVRARCPGNYLWLEMESQQVTEVVTGFGKLNVKAEIVARDAMEEARDYLKANVPIGIHLADQWMLPLAISAWQSRQLGIRGGGQFKTQPLTLHSTTHLAIIEKFLGVESTIEAQENRAQLVTLF